MKKRNLIWITLAASMGWSAASSAATIGTLDWDGTSGGFITNSAAPATQYLELGVAKDLTYAQTLTATNVGGSYEDYHIASQTEAFTFFNAMNDTTTIDTVGTTATGYIAASNPFSDGALGDTYSNSLDYVWFLSDETNDVGFIGFRGANNANWIRDSWNSFAASDNFAAGGSRASLPISWLLVSDHDLTAVPVPAAVLMFAPALLGFFGLRRKLKA